MAQYAGQLNPNEIFAAVYNMIISQHVFSDNIKKTNTLIDAAKVDGSMYGDTKLYYGTDALQTYDWENDEEAKNLLAIYRPKDPVCQAITIDTFRQIPLTLDNYLSKRAWSTEGAFSQFNSVVSGWLADTKRIYDTKTYCAFLGTDTPATDSQVITFDLTLADSAAQAIADQLANLLDTMEDAGTDYNDDGLLRSYDRSSLKVVWNTAYVNLIKKIDLPTIFHKEGLEDFGSYRLLPKFFGDVNASATAGDGSSVRSLIEQTIGSNHYWPGDLIDAGDTAPAGTSYTEDATIICKIYETLPPFMSGFEVGTSFFNPKSLTENRYLTFGHNTLQHLTMKPCIVIKPAS